MPKPQRKARSKPKRRRGDIRGNRRQRPSSAIVKASRPSWDLSKEDTLLVKNLLCPGASELEFQACIAEARHRRLDPIKKQIYFIPRWNSRAENADGTMGRKVWVAQISIDGLRHIAARDHRDYGTEDEPEYGPMKEIAFTVKYKGKSYNKKIMAPEWARVSVWKRGAMRPTVATVWWDEIYPAKNLGESPLVYRMPRLMLGKCASAGANRKAYPETGGLYIPEEFAGLRPDFSPDGRRLVYPDVGAPTLPAAIDIEVERQRTGSLPAPQKAIAAVSSQFLTPKPPTTAPVAAPAPAQPAREQPSKQYLGLVVLDYSQDEGSPTLRGDIANLTPLFQKHAHLSWAGDWWHCEPRDREAIKQICEECGPYQLQEILPKADRASGGLSSQSKAAASPFSPPEDAAAKRGDARTSVGASVPAAEVIKCKIERSIAGMNDKTPVRDVTVLTADKKKPTYRCWNKDYFEAFDKGIGQEAVLLLVKNKGYTNIKFPRRIGSKTWDEQGLAEIQKDREPSKTLFP